MPKPSQPPERMIAYVDGFNLYHGLHSAHGRSLLWLDVVELARLLRPRQQLVTVRYFSAPVLDEPEAQARQAHYLEALSALHPHQFEIVMGRYQSKVVTCRGCGRQHTTYEEKETDVNIAVSLVSDAALHSMTTALIISGDSDLAPAVRAAQRLRQNLFVAAAFPPQRKSKELAKLMPASFMIGDGRLRSAQMPASFEVGDRRFERPEKWR